MTFTDLIGDPDHAVKGSSTYLPNAEARAAEASAAAAATDDDADAAAAAPRVSLSPAPLRDDEEEEEERHVARRRIDRDVAANCRPRREEEQGHQKKEKSLSIRRPL